ncbi:MAG TPA: LysO family transporter [Clostridia bacterium]|nr:LysO family transporter [Clostridia bacterium]
MRIFLYIAIIFIGAWLGAGGKLSESFTVNLSKLQFISLLLLLFIMGVNIGVNDDVINGFYKLGFQAVVLAVFAIAFSVFFVKLVSGFVQRGRKDSE